MSETERLTQTVRQAAKQAGFSRVGVTSAGHVTGGDKFRDWLAAGCAAEMAYLHRNLAKRFHPAELVDGARSVICLAVSYAPGAEPGAGSEGGSAFVARYARGRDYHEMLRARCRELMDRIREAQPQFEGRAFVDSAPLAQRSLAAAAGVGWIGRNGCLIVPGLGSYVVLAEIVCNLELISDEPITGGCGDCELCAEACPTGACLGDSLIDARKCLSYLSIEHAGQIEREFWPAWGNVVFGCDECQAVCPHNRDVPCGDDELTGARTGAGEYTRLR